MGAGPAAGIHALNICGLRGGAGVGKGRGCIQPGAAKENEKACERVRCARADVDPRHG
jgi:hypothetical protein